MTASDAAEWNDTLRRQLVESIHKSPTMAVLAVAGGGNAVITDLLDVPGASRTVLEIVVPYSAASMEDLLGPDAAVIADKGAVSEETACAMAQACLERAEALQPGHDDLIGVACTAALVTDRHKRGAHRAHVAIARPNGTSHVHVELAKGLLDRASEDRVVADQALQAIAEACT